MSEQRFLPRLFVVERHASFQSNFTPILEIIAHHKPWKSAYGETKEYLSLAEHQHLMAEKDKRIERLREALNERWLVERITEWKHAWMDVKGTDERDRNNYFNRAFGVDANMKYDLARRILDALQEDSNG